MKQLKRSLGLALMVILALAVALAVVAGVMPPPPGAGVANDDEAIEPDEAQDAFDDDQDDFEGDAGFEAFLYF